MIAVDSFLDLAVRLSLAVLSISFLVTVVRVIRGPTLPDRVLALDMLVGVAIGFLAVIGIMTGYTLYLDIAIALGLVGFLATVAFSRFVLTRGRTEEQAKRESSAPGEMALSGEKVEDDAAATLTASAGVEFKVASGENSQSKGDAS